MSLENKNDRTLLLKFGLTAVVTPLLMWGFVELSGLNPNYDGRIERKQNQTIIYSQKDKTRIRYVHETNISPNMITYDYLSIYEDVGRYSTQIGPIMPDRLDLGDQIELHLYDENQDGIVDRVSGHGWQYKRGEPRTETLYQQADAIWQKYKKEMKVEETIKSN